MLWMQSKPEIRGKAATLLPQNQLDILQSFCQNGQQLGLGEERCGGLKRLDTVDYCSRTKEGLLFGDTRHDHGSLICEGRQNSQIDWTWWQIVWG